MIEVSNEITVHEVNRLEIEPGKKVHIWVRSHWNSPRLVVIVTLAGEYTVAADDLAAAIKNATNTARYS